MDGSLYAGIGDWEGSSARERPDPGAQVLRLNSPTGSWVEDQDFIQGIPTTPARRTMRRSPFSGRRISITTLTTIRLRQSTSSWPVSGIYVTDWTILEKTVKTGSVGAQGTWTQLFLVAPPKGNGQVRSFASYTDSVTHREMAFAGSNPYGIFSGAFNSSNNGIQWGATAEAGTASLTANGDRVMSFAACGGKLYASIYDAIVVRTDGASPSWRIFHRYAGPALPSLSSGYRGLTCVPNLNGSGSMLIAALEGNSADIYDFPLDGSQPTIELYTSNFLATQLGAWVGYAIRRIQQYGCLPSIRIGKLPRSSHWSRALRVELCKRISRLLSYRVIPHTALQWGLRLSDHR